MTTVASPSYAGFAEAVARRQLHAWAADLPAGPVLDLTPGGPAATLNSPVIGVCRTPEEAGRATPVVCADEVALDCFRPGCLAGIVAETGALDRCLLTEATLVRMHALLRERGRLLLSVGSTRSGLAQLAAAGRWAELADAPQADVLLIPDADGRVTRCFTPEELTEVLTEAGFDVGFVRPRTVLSPQTVEHALATDAQSLAQLVETELRLAVEMTGEMAGNCLVASAVAR